MELILVCLAALLASGLTLFSGFGLGTILMPIFAIFFPIDLAVALTAIVHLCNNLFKLLLLGRHADRPTVLRFGLPAIAAAFVGARLLLWLSHLEPLACYPLLGQTHEVTPVKLAVACLMVFFAVVETVPAFERISIDKKYLPLGGLLSGFFGGLSGHQGAFRSVFLLRSGLSREGFIATGVVIACLVDLSRVSVYGTHLRDALGGEHRTLVALATLSAFLGAFLGARLIPKIQMRVVQGIVVAMLFAIAAALGSGFI